MPSRKVLGNFEIDSNHDPVKYVQDQVDGFRERFEKLLKHIDSINETTLQLISMFSLLDSMAQEWSNYPIRNYGEAFCDFILRYQKKCDYLEKVEPVTLFYHVEDQIKETILIPGHPPEKTVSLDSLGFLDMHMVKDIIKSKKADEILEYLIVENKEEDVKQKAKEHRLINLIYRMRCKATHEMTGLGEESNFQKKHKLTEPYYRDIGRIYVSDNDLVSDDICELVIPNAFIRGILVDCIDGYLSDCIAECRLPFEKNKITRKHILSWYDK